MKTDASKNKTQQVGVVINKKKSSMYAKNRASIEKCNMAISGILCAFLAESGLYPESIVIKYQRNKDNGQVVISSNLVMQ